MNVFEPLLHPSQTMGDKKETVLLKCYENNGDSLLIFDISLESSIALIMHAINTMSYYRKKKS